ncbi:MAG: Integral membrane protein MviN [Candidatus Woesebacteria bacterium]|nr:MAG: Integral membrane protein MviN [Candidatus Woesebacteria bacterium]
MIENLIKKGRQLLSSQQTSILSAATLIMLMVIASRFLGLVRQRVLANYFSVDELSLFFAAFRLPDTIFEVLVFGTFSSAFVPVFARTAKKDENLAWGLAASVLNIGVILFVLIAVIFNLFAEFFYSLATPGFSSLQQAQIVALSRYLFLAQGFFVASYVLTGVLESLKRFLIPALAPVFYNLGIIAGTILFSNRFHLMAPVLGVVLGASFHFLIQYPLARSLGFRFSLKITDKEGLKKIKDLAWPRLIEVSFLQISKFAELFFSSLISSAAYAYYTFGNTLQLLPVSLVGTSISKAALPNLADKADEREVFRLTLWKTFNEMVFLILPIASILIVLRIPIVRLVYGTDIFDWEATVQTGMVLSAFAFGVVFQAVNSLLARAFYAMHNTKTPVSISIATIFLVVFFDFVFIYILKLPAWGLAAAFSLGSFLQSVLLFYFLEKNLGGGFLSTNLYLLFKKFLAALGSSLVMFFTLKFFDRSVWIKKLSFLGKIEAIQKLSFEKFVLDTRYTFNLLILTITVSFLGILVYLILSYALGNKELLTFTNLIKRILPIRKKLKISELGQETVNLPNNDGGV